MYIWIGLVPWNSVDVYIWIGLVQWNSVDVYIWIGLVSPMEQCRRVYVSRFGTVKSSLSNYDV